MALRPTGRERPLVHVPMPVVSGSLRALERVPAPPSSPPAEEADLMEEPMVTSRGTADAEALGVKPLRMSAVLGGRVSLAKPTTGPGASAGPSPDV